MFGSVRDFLNKSPWLGWLLAALLLAVSIWLYTRGSRGSDPYSPERMQESIVIRFTDTNDEITMTRGKLDRELRRSGSVLDPAKGVVNPKTGQPTGFPFNKSEWDSTIARINQEKEMYRSGTGTGAAPTAPPAPAPK